MLEEPGAAAAEGGPLWRGTKRNPPPPPPPLTVVGWCKRTIRGRGEGGRWEGGWGAACYSRESQVRQGGEEEEEGAAKERKIGGRGFWQARHSQSSLSVPPPPSVRPSVAARREGGEFQGLSVAVSPAVAILLLLRSPSLE